MRRAMILAAGRGERMGNLTKLLPKPLLQVQGKPLIAYVIDNLKQAGIKEIVVNVSYHAEQIIQSLGDGQAYGVKISYSEEPERLETGGGILQALPLLGPEPFVVVSGDVMTDYPLAHLPQQPEGLAHLVLVQNPHYHATGDYTLKDGRVFLREQNDTLTYANIGVFHPDLFLHRQPGHFRLTEVLNPAVMANQVSGEYFQGKWLNIGTPLELEIANAPFFSS